MSINLLREINELVVEADIEQPDNEILSRLGLYGFPNRAQRLNQAKLEYRKRLDDSERKVISSRSLSLADMLQDIVKAMHNPNKVPEGLLVAFREQSQNQEASEDDIREIWESFARLGLIATDEKND